jgi:hypothetical protein
MNDADPRQQRIVAIRSWQYRFITGEYQKAMLVAPTYI